MLNIAIAIPEDRSERSDYDGVTQWFAIDPADLYPMMFEYMKGVKESGNLPSIEPLRSYGAQLAGIHEDAFNVEGDHPDRDKAIELGRVWFSEVLHISIGGGPMGVHLTPSRDEWRLSSLGNRATPFLGIKEG